MVQLSSLKRPKVPLTVYLEPDTKRGLKIAAALDGVTASKLVEQLVSGYIEYHPAVQKALRDQ